jgi:hypothetical protein
MTVRFTVHNEKTLPASSIIESVDYYVATKKLVVLFHSGKVYQYDDVDQDTILNWREAESIGSFFVANIKNSFKYQEI